MSNARTPKHDGPKILFIDIETSPNLGWVWGMFQQNLSLSQLKERTSVISFAAKWQHRKAVEFHSVYNFETGAMDGHDAMIERAWELMNEADMIVHYNGVTFDIKHLNREFWLAGMAPPAPHKDIDLLQVMKSRFRFVSNKLDNITKELGQAGKVAHTGFDLWVGCMQGNLKDWRLMRKYNKGDVTELEELYDRALPWIKNHPHVGLYYPDGEERCSRCGGTDLIRKGYAYTPVGKFQQYKCRADGSWSRGKKRLASVDIRGI